MAFADDVRTAAEATEEASRQLAYYTAVATAAGVSTTEAAKALQKADRQRQDDARRTEAAYRSARDALLGMTLAFKGLALAGVRQSLEWDRFKLAFDRFTFALGGVYKPTIDAVSRGLFTLAEKAREMSAADQARIRTMTLTIGVGTMFTRMLQGLGLAMGPWTAVIGLFVGSLASSEKGREALAKIGKALIPLFQALADVMVPLADALATVIGWLK